MSGQREEDGTDSTPPKSPRSRRRKGSRSPTSGHCIRAKKRQAQVMRLAKEGWSLEQIAKRIGYADRSGAWRALKAALSGLAQPDADEYRKIQNERDDYLYSCPRSRIKRGDPVAVHAAIAVQNHQAKLNGSNIKRFEVTSKDGEPLLLTLEQARRLIDLDDERERKEVAKSE